MGGKEGEHEWLKRGMQGADDGINRKRRIWARAYANLLAYWGVVLGKLILRSVITEEEKDWYNKKEERGFILKLKKVSSRKVFFSPLHVIEQRAYTIG